MKFFSPEVAPYLYESTIGPYIEYYCHVWAGARSWCLDMLDKLQKQLHRTVDPKHGASLDFLGHCRNIVNLSPFYRYFIVRCSSELAELFLLPYSQGRSTSYSDRLHDFSVNILR